MFLVDTCVFLEILLAQENRKQCKQFLKDNRQDIYITDFTLHSIGVILFRYKREDIFQRFIEDMLSHLQIISLPMSSYAEIVDESKRFSLNFDDAYQYLTAKDHRLAIATLDRDFSRVKDIEVLFL